MQDSDKIYLAEIGSWHGRSARAISDNMPSNAVLFCIDTWSGSKVEQETNHVTAKLDDGDNAYLWFCREMWDHIISGRVIPLRMTSANAAQFLSDRGVQLSFIFIDAGHSKGETKADIESFLPLRKEGGIICGHDYMNGMWADVTTEVLEVFGANVGHAPDTTIWFTDSKPIDRSPAIFDCFIFGGEIGMAELRFSRLFDVVDRFVVVEATKTHSGKPKELEFEKYLERLQPYLSKVTYIVVDDLPEVEGTVTDKSWARERFQRDAIMRGLTQCRDTDVIIIADCDELPSAEAIQSYNGCNEIRSFEMDLFYYHRHNRAKDKWREAKILPYGLLKQHSPCWARYQQAEAIPNGGEHMSYFGGVENIIRKLENTAHQEYNTPEFKDPDHIRTAIATNSDLFKRPNVEFVKCE